MAKVAIIQDSPVFLNKQATLEKMCAIVDEVAAKGAEVVAFPEAFIAGYPAWIWRLRPGADWSWNEALHARLFDNAVDIKRGDLALLQTAAARNGVTVLTGINEKEPDFSRGTLYNSLVLISHRGEIRNHHRKLMPTNPERMVWGQGDGRGLNVTDTPQGRIGALICWENYMPLARYTLFAQGVQCYFAPTYDSGEVWLSTLRHIAKEGGCWVIGCGVALERSDLPADLPGLDTLYGEDEDWINPGDSVLIAPGGEIKAGPCHQEKTHLIVELDTHRADSAKRTLDVAGHYARPDVFFLDVNTHPAEPVTFNTAKKK